MEARFTKHPSSYRDPSGFLFYQNNILYRQVNKFFKEDFDQFISGGLYQQLTGQGLLIRHRELHENLTGSSEWYRTLQPEPLPFISYPYEWCFDMLKDAALATLEAAREAMRYGMMLKDASAYNLQWHEGSMMFIDTISFEKYEVRKPWIAYRQFCEHFLAPLTLMHYLKEPLQELFLSNPDGIPLRLAQKLLPFKTRFRLPIFLHLHLQSTVSKKMVKQKQSSGTFSAQKLKNLLRSLEETISSFSFNSPTGPWSSYYEEAFQRENYISEKKQAVSEWIDKLTFNSVLDAGANEGEFSEMAANKAAFVISTDLDHFSINKLYKRAKETGLKNIHPLVMDLSHPSPAIGLNNEERASFLDRARTDLVIALALIHHLAIGKNIPFENIAKFFYSTGKFLLIEFIPKDDEKIKTMLSQKRDVYDWYSREQFLNAFSRYFTILETKTLRSSGRDLYLMQAI